MEKVWDPRDPGSRENSAVRTKNSAVREREREKKEKKEKKERKGREKENNVVRTKNSAVV